MDNWTKDDWMRWQNLVIREEMKEDIDKESDRRAPVLREEMRKVLRVS